MNFVTLDYLIFLPLVLLFYYLLSYKLRMVLLLISSYYFYMCWKPEYIILILISTLIDYSIGLGIESSKDKGTRKALLITSLCSNLGILFAFKYFNFFNDSFRELFNSLNIFYGVPDFNVALPIAISFYTFQTIGYSVDIYRGHKRAEKNFVIFAVYVTFFPQLVAGPIERSTRLIRQFYLDHKFKIDNISIGLKQVLWGYFKKVVIADNVAVYVNQIYNHQSSYDGAHFILATVLFAFQIYCDFSGYTDIAIGSAKMMGFDLMKNFNFPYFSTSIRDFWHRWHISLSTWFRDYLYKPLGGSQVSKERWYFNIMAVFVISGLWHGANWTFLLWGFLHGAYFLIGAWTHKLRKSFYEKLGSLSNSFMVNLIKGIVCFTIVNFAWIFFRANSFADLKSILAKLLSVKPSMFAWSNLNIELANFNLSTALFMLGTLVLLEYLHCKFNLVSLLSKQVLTIRWFIYVLAVIIILLFVNTNAHEFIYFQF